MASATRKSVVGRAGAAARTIVTSAGSGAGDGEAVAGADGAQDEAVQDTAKKTTAKRTGKVTATKAAAKKTAARKTATKTAATKTAARTTPPPAAAAAELVVLEVEDPWTKEELAAVRAQLIDDVRRLTGELADVEGDLAGMIENSGEGAGNDQADVGSASFERDQEMVIVNNARDMLEQSRHAVERIGDGSYGQCEICGQAIGKNRLMAFPRAELCLTCKQREERR